jgi:hypothetical protein
MLLVIAAQRSSAFVPSPAPFCFSNCAQSFNLRNPERIQVGRAGMHFEKTSKISLNLLPPAEVLGEDKRVLYTAIYAAGHSLIAVPFLFFWNVEPAVKLRAATFAFFPVLALWIALLGGWLRF